MTTKAVIPDHRRMKPKTFSHTKLTSGQVAEILHCSISHVRRIPKEKLDYIMVGTHRRYEREHVELYKRAHQGPQA